MTTLSQLQRLDTLIVMLGKARSAAAGQCFFASKAGYLAAQEIERFLEVDLTDLLLTIAHSGGFTCDEMDEATGRVPPYPNGVLVDHAPGASTKLSEIPFIPQLKCRAVEFGS